MKRFAVVIIILSLCLYAIPCFALVNFPEAEGFGAETVGGRGDTIYRVTSTAAGTGAGTLGACIAASGPRICVFATGGTIQSNYTISNPYITIAGQSAPGGGITIRGQVIVATHNVVLRYLTLRSDGQHAIGVWKHNSDDVHDIIIDHCSMSWATDENYNPWYRVYNLTTSWSIISEPLNPTNHGMAAQLGGYDKCECQPGDCDVGGCGIGAYDFTFHNNLLAHYSERGPTVQGSADTFDIVNNVMYNSHWSFSDVYQDSIYGTWGINYVKNYFKEGPDGTGSYEVANAPHGDSPSPIEVYVEGNIGPHRTSDAQPEYNVLHTNIRSFQVDTRLPISSVPVTETSATQAYTDVLAAGGAGNSKYVDCSGTWNNRRDAHDERIISDVQNGTGEIIDSPSEVGGWLTISVGTPCTDTDTDGMPDAWETLHGLNPNSASDNIQDSDSDGYINIEEYLNGSDPNSASNAIYVDNTLSSNCTSGNYSISSRTCAGADGDAYKTVQEAVNAAVAGYTIYMRGGTYAEHVSMYSVASGTDGNRITLRSYPGEWAKLDPGHDRDSGYDAYVIYYKDGTHEACPKYWTFSNFEVTGGGTTNSGSYGGGFLFDTGTHLTFEYLYIHDNYANTSNNSAGIALFSESGDAPQYNIIRYCVLKDNTCDSDNCANINIMTSYRLTPEATNIDEVVSHNEIYYNYIEGSHNAFKHKGPNECITRDNTGANMTYKDYGDKIHHNIVTSTSHEALVIRQDFAQVYNNIIDDTDSAKLGITFGSAHNDPEREPFHVVSYNNLTIGCDQTIRHENNSVYGGELNPFIYWYNNIFESVAGPNEGYDQNVFPYDPATNTVDMDTVTAENNLFVPRTSTENIIEVNDSNYTATSFKAAGYSTTLYNATSTSGLHTNGDYKCVGSFSVGGGKTISDGGWGGSHPYLDGITIPSYIGAVDPLNDDWVDGVLGLDDLTGGIPINLRDGSGDPDWLVSSEEPPLVTAAIVNSSGVTVAVSFDNLVYTTSYATGDLHLDCTNGISIPLVYSSGTGSSSLTFTTSQVIFQNESCTIDFDDLDDGGNSIEDGEGTDLETCSDCATVTNSSTQNPGGIGASMIGCTFQ